MYPRNTTTPPRISVGAVVQISDGAVQTAGVSVVVRPEGGVETAGAGTVSYGASSGVVYYAPTQAETNHTAFVVVAYKAGCIPAEKTVVTSESTVSGRVYVGTNGDKSDYALSTASVNAIADQVLDEPQADHITVGTLGYYIGGVLLAANFNQRTVSVTGSGHIAASIHNAEPDSIPAGALTDAAIAEIQSGIALQSTLLLVAGYTDTEIAAIKVVTDKLNTGLIADGAVFQFTANMLELAPAGGGGGGSGDATAANQQLILDQLDVIQAKTDLIGTSQALLAGAVLAPGTITSFPEILTIGDSYTVANGRAIQIPIIDSNGNPISEAGTLLFADADVSFVIKRASDTEASRILTCNASFVDPPGTGTGEGPYALIEIPAEETAKGLMKYQYSGILKFTWPGTADEVISFETGTITFDN